MCSEDSKGNELDDTVVIFKSSSLLTLPVTLKHTQSLP